MENNTTWCGSFALKADSKEIIDKLQFASELLFLNKQEVMEYVANQKDILTIETESKEIWEINLHTFLFFQDYQKYWQIFKNLNNVNIKIVLEDLFSKNSYIDFVNVDETNKKSFFSDLLFYFNENLFKHEIIEKKPKIIKKLLSSYAFKEIFKNAKNNFLIPEKYQESFLDGISEENIIQYNWNAFKKVFNSTSPKVKEEYFNKKSKLGFFVPMLKLAYSYSYAEDKTTIIYKNNKEIKAVRNNFEDFFVKNQKFFQTMPLNEQKTILTIFAHHSRKELFEYVFHNCSQIQRENYSDIEYQNLLQKVNKSELNIDLDKYFLFKKLNEKLTPTRKEKRLKI